MPAEHTAPTVLHADPFDRTGATVWLQAFARRIAAGEPRERVGEELLTLLWPWAVRTADRMARRLPPGSDQDGMRSDVLWEVFQAVWRIDWERHAVWPALLKARLRGARSAAARAEDPLTRGERRARTGYLAAWERAAQHLRTTPGPAKHHEPARQLGPRGASAPVLLGRALLVPLSQLNADPVDTAPGPAALALRAYTSSSVQDWIDHDLPDELAAALRPLLERDEGDRLPVALRRRLLRYAGALRERLDEWGEPH
ncbi:hypothetical protein ACIHCQ_43205 [Streptomyces sp. NPDC052236]|uniref:hypothetical protein n=1 Tax=Streptomyces sp. NPDC052236 TaxID=3365686 RepID=UPI0037D8D3AC